MSNIEFKRKKISGGMPKIWRGECKILPGSYKITNLPPVGSLIERGTLVSADTSKLECTIIKTVKAVEDISGKTLSVTKWGFVQKGDKISNGNAFATVEKIDSSKQDKDILTLSQTIENVKAGDVLFETEDGNSPIAEPNTVVGADKSVKDASDDVIDLAFEANVLKGVTACPEEWLDAGMCLKNNHSIKFFNQ